MIAVDSIPIAADVALVLVGPLLFFIGAWFVDRRIRRRCGSLAKRWFALSLFSFTVLAVFVVVTLLLSSPQLSSSRSPTVVSISYDVDLGFLLMVELIAVPAMIVGVCGGILSRIRAAARREV